MSTTAEQPAERTAVAIITMRTAGVTAWVLTVGFMALGTFADLTENEKGQATRDDFVGWLIMSAVLAGVAVLVYRFWYGRAAESAPRTALIGGALSLLAIPVFWLGLPTIFAIGAIVLGMRSEEGRAIARSGAVLGAAGLGMAAWLAVAG